MSTTVAHADAHMADGDQHPHPTKADEHTGPRFEEGVEGSHKGTDPKDSRSLSGRANAEKAADKEEDEKEREKEMLAKKPTAIAESHGNEPSKGAKIDEQILNEEEEEIRKKDEAKAQSKAAKK